MAADMFVRLVVEGTPAPQAGMRAVTTGKGMRLISTGGTKLADWRRVCSIAARHAASTHGCFSAPVDVAVAFHFLPPAARARTVQREGWLWKATPPDLDKLQRAVGDSLTAGGLIIDDKLIVRWLASKIEADWSGAIIVVTDASKELPAL